MEKRKAPTRRAYCHHMVANSSAGHAHIVIYVDSPIEVDPVTCMNDILSQMPHLAGTVEEVNIYPHDLFLLSQFIKNNFQK